MAANAVKSWIEIIAHAAAVLTLAASVVAVVVSVITMREHRRLGHETSTQTLIHAQYELCRALDVLRLQHPEISHMLALPVDGGDDDTKWQNYHLFKDYSKSVIGENGSVTEAAKRRVYLQEHAIALHVFDIYEQTLLQRSLAERAGDLRRFQVLDELAKYYEGRMLRNPRLRYHWDRGGADMMDVPTRQRYDECVRRPYPKDPTDYKSPAEG